MSQTFKADSPTDAGTILFWNGVGAFMLLASPVAIYFGVRQFVDADPDGPASPYAWLVGSCLFPVLGLVLIAVRQPAPSGSRVVLSASSIWLRKTGGGMVWSCFVCLVVGRMAVAIFFPEARGQGIGPVALLVLIPIWSIGILGLAAWITGFVWGSFTRRIVAEDKCVQEQARPDSIKVSK